MPEQDHEFRGLIGLETLPPSDKIYQGVNDHGWLLLQRSLVYEQEGRRHRVAERFLVALALTEVCCEIGKGKVYYFPTMKQHEFDRKLFPNGEKELGWSFHRLPKLVYLPFVWREEDKVDWLATAHLDRLAMLNARSGGLSHKDVVMPIDLIYDEIEKKNIRVSGFTSKDTGCMATLAILPKPYVGWITQFQRDYKRFEFSEEGFDDGLAWYVTTHEILERNGCAKSDAEGVVEELWKMSFARQERSLMVFEDILRALIDFYAALPQ